MTQAITLSVTDFAGQLMAIEAEELCVLSCFVYYFEHIQQHYSYNRLLSSLQAMLCARANA